MNAPIMIFVEFPIFIYTLSKGCSVEKEDENKVMADVTLLLPSIKMMEVAEKARITGTTLWFSKKDMQENRLKDIISTAQFKLYNALASYFEELEKNPSLKN